MPEEDKEIIRNIWINGCSCTDACSDEEGEDQVDITFEIPGVKKEMIDLKVVEEGLRLEAWRDKTTRYVSEYAFLCTARTKETKAEYHDGILNVHVPLACKDPYLQAEKIHVA